MAKTTSSFNGSGVPASLPGALSSRTDRQPIRDIPDAAYGEQSEFRAIQGGAPMAQMDAPPPMPGSLFAPTARPQEPVTAGAEYGDGPGPEAITPMPARPSLTQTLQRVAQADPTGDAQFLAQIAARLGW